MKKLIIALSVMLSTHYTHTMVVHAEAVPVAHAVESSHQPDNDYNNVPVAAVARPYNPKTDAQIYNAKTGTSTKPSLADQVFNKKPTPTTVADEFGNKINLNVDHTEPIITYNAKGEKVSEHLINDDGSEHNTVYNSNGDVTTTILDHNKIKQQVTLLKPDKSSIVKHYDEKGKQVSVETINAAGEKVHTFNSSEGTLIASEIHNKNNQLEGSTFIDDWGNRTTSIHNPDGTSTSSVSSAAEITHEEDGSTTENSYDSHGNEILIGRDSDGKMTFRHIFNPDGGYSFFTYDPTTGKIIEKYIAIKNTDGSLTKNTYDPETDQITDKSITTENPDGSETTINYDPINNSIIGKYITVENPDESFTYTNYDPITNNIISKSAYNTDGSNIYTNYDPVTGIFTHSYKTEFNADGSVTMTDLDINGKPIEHEPTNAITINQAHSNPINLNAPKSKIENNKDGLTTETNFDSHNNEIMTLRDAHGKIISKTIEMPDGSQKITHYDPTQKDKIIAQIQFNKNADGSQTSTYYDPITNKPIKKRTSMKNNDGTETITYNDPITNKLLEKYVTTHHADDSETAVHFDPITNKIISNSKTIDNADGTESTITYYNPITNKFMGSSHVRYNDDGSETITPLNANGQPIA